MLLPGAASRVSDPMSGYFLLKKSLIENVPLRPVGYKILLEVMIRCPWRQPSGANCGTWTWASPLTSKPGTKQ